MLSLMARNVDRLSSLSRAVMRWRLTFALVPDAFVPLAIGVLLAAVLAAFSIWSWWGRTPYDRAVYGRVDGLSLQETDFGSYPVLRVQLGDQVVAVIAPRSAGCRVGDRVQLRPLPGLIGKRFAFGPDGCGS